MSRRAVLSAALVTAVLSLAALAVPAGAVEFKIAHGANGRCFSCHAEPDIGTIVVGGERKSLQVTEEHTRDSIHSRLDCTACHVGFQAGEHTAEETNGWFEQARLTGCSDCHADQFVMYSGSFHGGLVMDESDKRAPRCADCHGSHGIMSPGLPEFRETVLHMCSRCHGERAETYEDTYHGKSFSLGETTRAVCTDCHGHHKILPQSDPDSMVSDKNVTTTCGRCHEHASSKFASFLVHVDPKSPKSSLSVWFMEINHSLLIVVLFFVGGVHCFLYFYRGLKEGLYSRGKH